METAGSNPPDPPRRGRPAKEAPEWAARWLESLYDVYQRTGEDLEEAGDELCKAVYELRQREKVSIRTLARILGVGSSTVQDWSDRGKTLSGDE
jgi:hypothetical protein